MKHKIFTCKNNFLEKKIQKQTSTKNSKYSRKLYIETYGCQMNFSDSEIVASIIAKENFVLTNKYDNADLILINTCSIRDKAENKIRNRLLTFNQQKIKHPDLIIGILGCMAGRLKTKLLEEEKIVDLVVGPDAYKDLPKLINQVDQGHKVVNTLLSKEETYADVIPIRLYSDGVTAFISIMRGCNNMCSFCIVPFTRGRERSKDPDSIIQESKNLFKEGYKEITLLGQNVDSYRWNLSMKSTTISLNNSNNNNHNISIYNNKAINFSQLLAMVAEINPKLRVRFSTSHPKDMTDEVLYTMKTYPNICRHIHLPVQSGNNRILKLMNRTYDRAWYIERIISIKNIIGPLCSISSDIIAGFCSETEEEHADTLSLMDYVQYDFSFMFYYSERPGTLASRKYLDDIPELTKKRRLSEIIAKQREHTLKHHKKCIGEIYEVLIEKYSKKSKDFFQGRTSQNNIVVFPKENFKIGDYVKVKILDCNVATLFGIVVAS